MIANRFFGSAKQLNYKYIIGELLLIFTGISLSLYFDDWRERRSDDQKLKETLNLIVQSVQNDTTQLKIHIVVNNDISSRMAFLLDSSRYEKEPSRKTINNFAHINLYFPFDPDFSAYENLKQQGMGIIKDQALRVSIIKYYVEIAEQQKFTQDIVEGHFGEQLAPYIIDSFVDYQRGDFAVPEDFDELKKDKRFWKLVKRSGMFCEVTASQMRGRIQLGSKLLSRLSEELKR